MKTVIQCINEAVSESQRKMEIAKSNEGIHADISGKGGKCGWFKTANSCIDFLIHNNIGNFIKNKYFDKFGISEENMIFIIKKLYQTAENKYGPELCWNTVPFVFGEKELCIREIYPDLLKEFKDFLSEVKTVSKPYNLSSLNKTHNGFGGAKSGGGLSYENTIVSEMIQFINKIMQLDPTGKHKLSENELEQSFNKEKNEISWDSISHLYPIYDSGDLDNIINRYIKNPELDLTKYIIKTGQKKPDRNKKGQLFDKLDFTLNDSNIENDLKESGEIIADVTILGDNEQDNVYLSVKLNQAQLSGVNFDGGFNGFISSNIQSKTPWDDIKDNKEVEGFKNVFKTFGLDPEIIYNQYINKDFYNITDIKDYNEHSLLIFAQKLLGGNYWYVKPKESIFVPAIDNQKLKMNIKKYHNSNSGKTLTISGDINGIETDFIYRTDGNGLFPHRIFIKINVPDFVEEVTK